jgi:hypothetical protein
VDEQEYDSFLLEVATGVGRLVAKNRIVCVRKFHVSAKGFCEKEDAYCEAFERAQKDARHDSSLRDYNDGTAPKEGFVWVSCHGISAEPASFWSLPLPFSPDTWILYYFGWNYPCGPDRPTEPTKSDRLICEYVVLGLIHDEMLQSPECDCLCNIADNE